jgi:hypothetical protein
MLTLNQRERDRLAVLHEVEQGLIPAWRGAELVGLEPREFRRLRREWERKGDIAVIHGLRGRRSNRAKSEALRAWALERARDPLYHDFGPTLLSEHLARDPEAPGVVGAATLRLWMIAAGRWKPGKRRARHRKARARRAAFGELIQWDSSEHAWFEDRGPRCTLIQMHDDATNRLLMARFVPRDDGPSNRQIAIDYLRRWGRPVAFYTDKAGHFGQWTRPVSRIPLEERDIQRTESIIRRALEHLNVRLILAHSPQAKGRIERDFGTSQDRLVKELRVAGVSDIESANRFLEEVYIPYWNERFAVEPAQPRDAHRPLPKKANLEALFAETWTRTVREDFTIRFLNRRLQIPKDQARGIRPSHKLTVEQRLDGSLHYRFNNRYIRLEPVEVLPSPRPLNQRPINPKPLPVPQPARPRPMPPKPGPDHPWRRGSALLAKPSLIAKLRRAPSATLRAPFAASPSP